jgi:RNA polymerase sigma-70 factor (ECF subfamily)
VVETAGARATALLEPVRAYVARRVPSDAVDDVVQDLFVRIARSDAEPDDLRAWVFAVARSAIADHFRKSARRSARERPEEGAEMAEPEPPEEPSRAREVLAAWLAVEVRQLPEPYAETLALTELEGLAHGEVAERLGLTGLEASRSLAIEAIEEAYEVLTHPRWRTLYAPDPVAP